MHRGRSRARVRPSAASRADVAERRTASQAESHDGRPPRPNRQVRSADDADAVFYLFYNVSLQKLCVSSLRVSRSHSRFASELAGLAFDSLQQVFRKVDIKIAISITPLPFVDHQPVWLVIDPVPRSASACPAPRPTCKPPRSLSAWCTASSRAHAGRPRR